MDEPLRFARLDTEPFAFVELGHSSAGRSARSTWSDLYDENGINRVELTLLFPEPVGPIILPVVRTRMRSCIQKAFT